MLSDRAKALRPVIQAAFDAGGLDAICELFAKLEARIEELEKRLNMNSSQIIRDSNPLFPALRTSHFLFPAHQP
jgi:hypothetical protein